jgi:hypothetical protein
MDVVGLYPLESPFPFAAAIIVICDAPGATVGECFLLVENCGAYIGFQRIALPPGVSRAEAETRVRELLQRVHAKMRNAAIRNGRLPQTAATGEAQLREAAKDLVAELRTTRGFADLLDWVAKQTPSRGLRAEIETCRASDLARLTSPSANQI